MPDADVGLINSRPPSEKLVGFRHKTRDQVVTGHRLHLLRRRGLVVLSEMLQLGRGKLAKLLNKFLLASVLESVDQIQIR